MGLRTHHLSDFYARWVRYGFGSGSSPVHGGAGEVLPAAPQLHVDREAARLLAGQGHLHVEGHPGVTVCAYEWALRHPQVSDEPGGSSLGFRHTRGLAEVLWAEPPLTAHQCQVRPEGWGTLGGNPCGTGMDAQWRGATKRARSLERVV